MRRSESHGLRRQEPRPATLGVWVARAATVASLLLAGGCSSRSVLVVAPDPCAADDAGVPGCIPTGILDNLVGWWRLDDGAGSKVAHDWSGRGNHGALRNLDPTAAWVAGRSGGGLEIGNSGFVEVPHSPTIDAISEAVTVSAWVYWEQPITMSDLWATALSRQVKTGIEQYYHLSIHMSGKPSAFINSPVVLSPLQAKDPVQKTTWIHIAATYDGNEARLYVNGAEADSHPETGKFPSDTTPVILGGNQNNAAVTELFAGKIDELMLYGRALGPAEIAELAAGALFPGGLPDAGTD